MRRRAGSICTDRVAAGGDILYNGHMSLLALDALLLFVLAVPVVMRYRILPIEGTPYWLFGILFLLLIVNVLISLYPKAFGREAFVKNVKTLLLIGILGIVIGGTTVTAMVDRSRTAPIYNVHDIILQQEAAMRYLLQGRNPYKETYFGTFLEEWHYAEDGKDAVNPALYHFVMPPWYLLFAFPFYFISIPLAGFFDGRMPLLFSLAALLVVLWFWLKDKQLARVAIVLTALSPATVDYFIEGRSDLFALFWLAASLYFLEKKRLVTASLIFGLALLSKQTNWLAAPLFFLYGWLVAPSARSLMRLVVPAFVVLAVVAGPFLAWDARALIESTVLYLSGSSSQSYPVSGYGLGMILHESGIIQDIHAYYPFIIWQLILAVPVIVMAVRFMKKHMSRLLVGYGVFLFVWWWASRYFNNSHVGYLSSIFGIAILKDWDERAT